MSAPDQSHRPPADAPAQGAGCLPYAGAFRLLAAEWGPPRRDLESPYWSSRDQRVLVCCSTRHGFGAGPTGALVLRCYSAQPLPFHFLAISSPCEAAMAARYLAELDLGPGPAGPSPVGLSGLAPLAAPPVNHAAARAAQRRSRDLRAHSRALLASLRIAHGARQRRRPAASARCA